MLPTQTGWDIGEVVDVVWHWQLVKVFFPCLPEALTQSLFTGLNFVLVRMVFSLQFFLMVMNGNDMFSVLRFAYSQPSAMSVESSGMRTGRPELVGTGAASGDVALLVHSWIL